MWIERLRGHKYECNVLIGHLHPYCWLMIGQHHYSQLCGWCSHFPLDPFSSLTIYTHLKWSCNDTNVKIFLVELQCKAHLSDSTANGNLYLQLTHLQFWKAAQKSCSITHYSFDYLFTYKLPLFHEIIFQTFCKLFILFLSQSMHNISKFS